MVTKRIIPEKIVVTPIIPKNQEYPGTFGIAAMFIPNRPEKMDDDQDRFLYKNGVNLLATS